MLEQQAVLTEIKKVKDILCSAKAKYRIGEYEEALVEYTLAIQFAPNIAVAFTCRGDTYSKLGKEHQAMTDYNQSIQLDPTAVVNYYRRGNLYYSAKNYPAALTEYSHAIELNPDFALAYIGRGHVNRELYGDREGVSDWRLAARLFQAQDNSEQYQYVTNLIELNMSIDTLSGML